MTFEMPFGRGHVSHEQNADRLQRGYGLLSSVSLSGTRISEN